MTEQNSNLLIENTVLAPQTGLGVVRGSRGAITLDLRAEPAGLDQIGGASLPAAQSEAVQSLPPAFPEPADAL